MAKVMCRYRNHRVPEEDARKARHFSGGNFRRPGRLRESTICVVCARELLTYATEGHTRVRQWSVTDLRRAVDNDPS